MAAELADRIGAVLANTRARRVGLVVGVSAGRETGFWHRGRLPDGPHSIFQIGSITKTFTTTLLADMARERLVALDDPVQDHLPDGVRLPVKGRAITLEDLATHRSGLPRLPKGLLVRALTRDRKDPYARLDEAALDAAIAATAPKREPGGRPVYSNYGMGLLGYVIALRAGMPYEQLVRTRICEPLGLADTLIEVRERRRVATGHTRRGRPTPHWNVAALAGAGGLQSTASNLLEFLALHFPTARSPLAAAAAETARPRARLGRAEIGLAWIVIGARRGRRWGRARPTVLMHDGGTGGFRSFAGVIPERNAAVVVLTNQARQVGRLGWRVLGELMR
jgi:D-alanyl-D-alanine-carboxypeptidase/D-alanyl-D-alanine-endopeptidase